MSVVFTTITVGTNPEYADELFYAENMHADEHRVQQLFLVRAVSSSMLLVAGCNPDSFVPTNACWQKHSAVMQFTHLHGTALRHCSLLHSPKGVLARRCWAPRGGGTILAHEYCARLDERGAQQQVVRLCCEARGDLHVQLLPKISPPTDPDHDSDPVQRAVPQEAPDVGIPVHERSLKSGEVKACMLSGLYVMIMLVDKSKLGDPWPWSSSPESSPALVGAKPSYTGASLVCTWLG